MLLALSSKQWGVAQRTMAASTAAAKRARVFLTATEEQICKLGGEIMGRDPAGKSEPVFEKRWMSFYGVSPTVCFDLWNQLCVPVDPPSGHELCSAKPEHLLWALLWLKVYGNETELARLCGATGGAIDEKTFWKWTRIFVTRIAYLLPDVVSGIVAAFC